MVFDSIVGMHYKCHKVSLNCGRSYTDSHDWIKSKNATTNPSNNDECFQYAASVALNHEIITKDPQRISKIKLFVNDYNKKNGIFIQKEIGESLNLIISQLLLMLCLLKLIKKK